VLTFARTGQPAPQQLAVNRLQVAESVVFGELGEDGTEGPGEERGDADGLEREVNEVFGFWEVVSEVRPLLAQPREDGEGSMAWAQAQLDALEFGAAPAARAAAARALLAALLRRNSLLTVSGLLLGLDALTVVVKEAMQPAAAPAHLRTLLNVANLLVAAGREGPDEVRAHLASQVLEGPGCCLETVAGWIADFSGESRKDFPIKKALVLFWKMLMACLGSSEELREAKARDLEARGLASFRQPPPFTAFKSRPSQLAAYEGAPLARFYMHRLLRGADQASALPEGSPPAEALRLLRAGLYLGAEEPAAGAFPPPPPPTRPAEAVYRLLVHNLHKYLIIMLKILLAASPTVKNYTGSIVLTGEVDLPGAQAFDDREVDFARHKEIILKATSAALLLLMKHFKSNSVAQFLFLSQHLSDSNCVLLILKFFNQELAGFLCRDSDLPQYLVFPQPARPLAFGKVPSSDPSSVAQEFEHSLGEELCLAASRRNLHTATNLLRILRKLTKRNPTRIRSMIAYKAQVIIKRLLKVKDPVIELYTLKLLKSVTRFLGRKWVVANMKVISAIYERVRPDLIETFLVAEPGTEEAIAQEKVQAQQIATLVENYNALHYNLHQDGQQAAAPQGTKTFAELYSEIELDDDFKNNYRLWLSQEVFAE
jgi:hypothetical protein